MVVPGSSSYAPVFFTPHSETIARKVRENLNSPGSDSMLVQVDGKDSGTVVDTLIGQIQRLLDRLITSLIWDRGTELAHRARLTVATDVAVYFCDPRSPWQRGNNENTNGLLRQYFPKGTDLSALMPKPSRCDSSRLARRGACLIRSRLLPRRSPCLSSLPPSMTLHACVQ